MSLAGQDLLTLAEFTPEHLRLLIERTKVQKRMWSQTANRPRPLHDRAVAVVLLKPSMRTRVSFEIAIRHLGGIPVMLGPDTFMSRGESLADAVKVLERYCDCIVLRTFEQRQLEHVAEVASVPVINALTDDYHPCQVLADLVTIEEARGQVAGLKVAYVGDGNNMANTWLIGAALAGIHLALACPEGFEPLPEAAQHAVRIAQETGSTSSIIRDPRAAVADADVVITDTWVSMGQEDERARKLEHFRGYTVTTQLMALAKGDAIFLHCLPAHRGQEVTDEVMDGPQSRVYDEAGNRMSAQKALLSLILG